MSLLLINQSLESHKLAVSLESLESAVTGHQPDLAALSVTMRRHLLLCKEANVWKTWRVDAYVDDARVFLQWADDAV